MNATNNITNLDAATVAKIIEAHINESLSSKKFARATTICANGSGSCEPNRPSLGISVTFDVLDRPAAPNPSLN